MRFGLSLRSRFESKEDIIGAWEFVWAPMPVAKARMRAARSSRGQSSWTDGSDFGTARGRIPADSEFRCIPRSFLHSVPERRGGIWFLRC